VTDFDRLEERIVAAINDSMAAGELDDCCMVDHFVLVATGFDNDGDSLRFVSTNGDLVTTLGLLTYGMARQQAALNKIAMREEDE
jgi:hypothetical protein